MIDCNYSKLIDVWASHPKLFKYQFPLDAWIARPNDEVMYDLREDTKTTKRILKVMEEEGYTSSIIKNLLSK